MFKDFGDVGMSDGLAEDPADALDPELEESAVSTGHLDTVEVDVELQAAYERYRGLNEGVVADDIPALAGANPDDFGLGLADVDGGIHVAGAAEHPFSIQSISKAFVFALVCHELGHEAAWHAIGVNNTGLPFNSVMALELGDGSPMNPMVNAGALATTALVPGASAAAKWKFIQDGLSRFAGRTLSLDIEVYESEALTNHRNRAIAQLLESYGHLAFDPLLVTDIYTKGCSLTVTARDIAVMGATLADGGVNPVTREQVVDPSVCRHVLAVMASAGLYERSGDWLWQIGMPGKSGVSGGIVTISPGKGGLGSYSPLLDSAGNSVRGQRAARYLSASLGLNLFSSSAEAGS